MSTYQEMRHCPDCGKPTLHLRYKTGHILHLLLSVLTLGAWLVVWLAVGISNGLRSQCTVCGRTSNWGSEAKTRKIVNITSPAPKPQPQPDKTLEELLRDGNG